ncbi:hypothetical protein F7734_53060 [Scytonema sp. UIC 10036]|uniref:hypothetical protein n=1 Tax=Scytonema sp. UIC 10036 TaxID=2304196 RepID=UPI0012DA8353|nr:hypothetical protein [Scytonema sp. UIC 10036]MUH00545.1 hypothetical protein [Scytonema sp. UIC 10036]
MQKNKYYYRKGEDKNLLAVPFGFQNTRIRFCRNVAIAPVFFSSPTPQSCQEVPFDLEC